MKIKSNGKITWRIAAIPFLTVAIISCTVISYAGEVNSIKVRGKTVAVNDTADQVFGVLKGSDMVHQTVEKDPNNPNSLLVVKKYKVEGKKFTVYFARVQDPGPYKVVRIVTDACDREAARQVQTMLKDMATWQEKNEKITFTWGNDWDHASSQQRLGLIKAFADSDACLTGSARGIKYYQKGKLVGEASPTRGIKLLDK